MEVTRDEACALKVAKALSYINFSCLEKWYGQLGFIKIFQGLKEEGSDLGWALLLGTMECALSGDRHLPQEVINRIIRENRLTAQHLYDLYPGTAPVRHHPGGFRVHGLEPPPDEALPRLAAAVWGFGEGAIPFEQLRDELYRLHTPEMKDSLYYHALLAAKSVEHPISAHMLWKALRLLAGGNLSDEIVQAALVRLEDLQRQHLGIAMRRDTRSQSAVLEEFSAPMPEGARAEEAATGPPAQPDSVPLGYRERASRFLESRNISEYRRRGPRFAELSGYDDAHLDQLLQPFLLRCYVSDDEPVREADLILAVGPPEICLTSILEGIARGFGFPFLGASYRDFGSVWAGEMENDLLRTLARARGLYEKGRGLPAMLVFSENGRSSNHRSARPAATPQEVVLALGGLLTGPRRKEALGEGPRPPVITVATAHSPSVVDPLLRDRVTVLRFEPPGASELERLLVRDVVGRYYLCDFERISFSALAIEATGLVPGEIDRAAKRAKLAALERRARELRARLATATERQRARIRESYLITQEDLSRAIAEQRRERAKPAEPPEPVPGAPPAGSASARQTALTRWGSGIGNEGPPRARRRGRP